MSHLVHGLVLGLGIAAAGCDNRLPAPPPPLATGQGNITALKTDGDHVYWSRGDGSVQRVATLGGAVEEVVHGLASPSRLALNADSVYWVEGGQISRAAKAGSASELLIQNEDGLGDLQVDTGRLYWLRLQGQGSSSGQVRTATAAPGATASQLFADTLAPGALSLALAGRALYYPALDSSALGEPTSVHQLAEAGGAPTAALDGIFHTVATFGATVCAAGPDPQALATDSLSTAEAVTCAALDGSGARVLASGLASPVAALAVDGSSVYFATDDGSVSAASLDGTPIAPPSDIVTSSDATAATPTYTQGGPVTFAMGPAGGASLAADGTNVYWAYTNGDAVMSLPAF
jgi:hypothetical protein